MSGSLYGQSGCFPVWVSWNQTRMPASQVFRIHLWSFVSLPWSNQSPPFILYIPNRHCPCRHLPHHSTTPPDSMGPPHRSNLLLHMHRPLAHNIADRSLLHPFSSERECPQCRHLWPLSPLSSCTLLPLPLVIIIGWAPTAKCRMCRGSWIQDPLAHRSWRKCTSRSRLRICPLSFYAHLSKRTCRGNQGWCISIWS